MCLNARWTRVVGSSGKTSDAREEEDKGLVLLVHEKTEAMIDEGDSA